MSDKEQSFLDRIPKPRYPVTGDSMKDAVPSAASLPLTIYPKQLGAIFKLLNQLEAAKNKEKRTQIIAKLRELLTR